jgi:hypothetical protein
MRDHNGIIGNRAAYKTCIRITSTRQNENPWLTGPVVAVFSGGISLACVSMGASFKWSAYGCH